jgi:hypothetical protein
MQNANETSVIPTSEMLSMPSKKQFNESINMRSHNITIDDTSAPGAVREFIVFLTGQMDSDKATSLVNSAVDVRELRRVLYFNGNQNISNFYYGLKTFGRMLLCRRIASAFRRTFLLGEM